MTEITFVEFRDKLIENFNKHASNATHLFEVNLDKDELWNLYLDSFPVGTNEIYRERREYDCSCCRNFIKAIGNTVFIENNKVETIWNFNTGSSTYQPVVDALNSYVKQFAVANVYYGENKKIGLKQNHEQLENGDIVKYDHFYLTLPNKFVYKGYATIDTAKSNIRATKDVFKRSLQEITIDSVQTVLELISQNSIYRGNEWYQPLLKFLECQNEYMTIPDENKNNYLWTKSIEVGDVVGKIKNHSMGTLLLDISEGTDLDIAVKKYEKIVAPENYKRSNPIYTKKMLENARNKISELGYLESLDRRFATIDDITINDVLFANRNVRTQIKQSQNVFEDMENSIELKPKKFNRVQEIDVNDFINNVLPQSESIEVFLENNHLKNLMSLIAPKNKESKSMFKWDNGFSWAYTGNIADSAMRENVKKAGGSVDGVLRCSIQWNDEDVYNKSDYDLHCIEPNHNEIYYANKGRVHKSSGMLDVDIINPKRNVPAVENIIYTELFSMPCGTYKFFVHNFSRRSGDCGFKAEIEFNGEIYSFEYNKPLKDAEKIAIADVVFDGETFKVIEKLPTNVSSKEKWHLKTNQFIPVTAICYSPNYWKNNKIKTGNKHIFFMLKDCVNTECPNGFYVEYLSQELNEHRRVMEALGYKLAITDADEQLSGIGFSLTKRNSLTVKVKGATERLLKIKF